MFLSPLPLVVHLLWRVLGFVPGARRRRLTGALGGLVVLGGASAALAQPCYAVNLRVDNPFNSGLVEVSEDGQRAVGSAFLPGEGARAVLLVSGYNLVNLGTLGGTFSSGADISPGGRYVVGDPYTASGARHSFRWDDDPMIDLGLLPGAVRRYAKAVNNAGDVVDYMEFTTHGPRAFLWRNGVLTDLGTLAGDSSIANDINAGGEIVGESSTGSELHAVWWLNGPIQDLGSPGPNGTNSNAIAINDSGVIVGYAQFRRNATSHAFRLTDYTTWTDWGAFGVNGSVALGINNDGKIVGSSSDRAFLYENGVMLDLNEQELLPDPGVVLTNAYDISRGPGGVIVGTIFSAASGFVLSLDRDGDAVPDAWEILGIDADGDEIADLDLPAMGAAPDRKDIFVEVDAVTGWTPSAAGLQLVVDSFLRDPVDNVGGSQGIVLHIQRDETAGGPDFTNTWPDFYAFKATHWGTPAELANVGATALLAAKRRIFHYCVFVRQYGGTRSGGIAEYPGNDFICALVEPSQLEKHTAAVFMHELGHNLGLDHGGVGDSINYKPNYYSVMNHTWAYEEGWMHDAFGECSWPLDYSRAALPDLNEAALVERDGFGDIPVELFNVLVPHNFAPNG